MSNSYIIYTFISAGEINGFKSRWKVIILVVKYKIICWFLTKLNYIYIYWSSLGRRRDFFILFMFFIYIFWKKQFKKRTRRRLCEPSTASPPHTITSAGWLADHWKHSTTLKYNIYVLPLHSEPANIYIIC